MYSEVIIYLFDIKVYILKEQLCYFENVYFDVKEIDNNFTIHRSEYYQWSELCEVEEMHVCLDDVYYPIDWKKLDIDRIRMPLGVRFSLTDGLYPTPNREALRYTAEAKEVIKARITDVANHFLRNTMRKLKVMVILVLCIHTMIVVIDILII